jgi:hypothetical protein
MTAINKEEKLLRVIQRNDYSKHINIPASFCRILNIQKHDILSCKLNKNIISLQKVDIQ